MAEKKRKKDGRMQYGKDIESLQDKVDSYMDPKIPDGPSGGSNQTAPEPTDTKSAPLLPSDKIPASVAGKKEPKQTDKKKDKPKPKIDDTQEPDKPATEPYNPAYDEWPDPEEARKRGLDLEDRATSRAVDEIVAAESDKLLQDQDTSIAKKQDAAQDQPKPKGRLRKFLKTKKFKLIFGLLAIGAVAAMVVPNSRYYILNSLGVRASTSMRVVDAQTGQPLKDVEVSIGGHSSSTSIDGEATVFDIKLGKQTLTIAKPAFAKLEQDETIGWGSNPLGDMELKPVGAQYKFIISDYLSGKPIAKVEADSDEANAVSDKEGKLTLVVAKTDEEKREVILRAGGYRDEKIKVSPDKQEPRNIVMVPAREHAFVSKRSGTYDLYKSYIDGRGEKLLLAGTGSENEDELTLVSHPTDEVAAFVSVRGIAKSSSGELLSTLQVIDLSSDEASEIVNASRVQIIDWVGERLIYIKEQDNKDADDPSRNKLMSYNYQSGTETTLASANYFNDVSVAQGVVYYSPAGAKGTGLYRIDTNGSGKNRITSKEVWNIFRTAYDNLKVSLGQQWYDYNLTAGSFTKADGSPSVLRSRVYYDSPDRTKSIWSEIRDGKGALILYSRPKNQDETILAKSGLQNPMRWLDDNSIVFRVDSDEETADYAMSLSGGEPKKITDVTDVTGIDKWYFY